LYFAQDMKLAYYCNLRPSKSCKFLVLAVADNIRTILEDSSTKTLPRAMCGHDCWNCFLSRRSQLGSQSHQWGLHKCSCEWIQLPILQYSFQHLSHLGRGRSTLVFLKPDRLPRSPILFHHRCCPSYSCLLSDSPVPQLTLEMSPYSVVPW
jgi:hypothetical protein